MDISCAVSVVVFALDSSEREKREGSTTPCGVKGVVGPSSRAQSAWLRGENRMSTSTDNNASLHSSSASSSGICVELMSIS